MHHEETHATSVKSSWSVLYPMCAQHRGWLCTECLSWACFPHVLMEVVFRAATKVNTWKLHLHFWAIPSHPGIFKDGILKLCLRLKFVFHCFSLSWPLLLLLWLLVAGGKSLILWARSVVDHSFQRSPFPAIKGKISPLKLQLIAKAQFVVLLKMLWNELLRNCARKCLITVMQKANACPQYSAINMEWCLNC